MTPGSAVDVWSCVQAVPFFGRDEFERPHFIGAGRGQNARIEGNRYAPAPVSTQVTFTNMKTSKAVLLPLRTSR